MPRFNRRQFLQTSAAIGSLLASGVGRTAGAASEHIDTPVVDRVVIREITDNQHNIFLKPLERPGLSVQRTGFPAAAQGKTLESEWGLALHIETARGSEERRYLLDFGFTPEVYANNLEIMKIDPARVDALILSHGHFDHYGGLIGFLEARRTEMRQDLRLYTGGEDVFCHRLSRQPDDSFGDFKPALDRRKLKSLNVEPVLSEDPIVIAGHAFTTGAVPRMSVEHVLPQTWVQIGIKDGLGCDASAYVNHHFTSEELAGKPQPDQHWHEHATCFRLGDRGLVVITSCGHGGIINTLRRAQQISGVEKDLRIGRRFSSGAGTRRLSRPSHGRIEKV